MECYENYEKHERLECYESHENLERLVSIQSEYAGQKSYRK